MTYREEDEKQLFIGFMEWLDEHSWIAGADHKKRMWLVQEYMAERKDAREWGK